MFDHRWAESKIKCTRLKEYVLGTLMPAVRRMVALADERRYFPPTGDEENRKEHPGHKFLNKFLSKVSSCAGISGIFDEATVFFRKEPQFDQNKMLFQLANCMLDLETHRFRRTKPSDMCLKCSPIVIPEHWLGTPHHIGIEAPHLIREA